MITSECVKLFPFNDILSDAERDALCSSTSPAFYKARSNVHGGQSECTGVIFVKTGLLRVYMLSDEGREITLYRLWPGEICMLSASCVIRAVTFDVFVDAEEDSEVFITSPSAYAAVADKNIRLENFGLNLAVSRFSEVMWAMQQILFMSFDRRLAVFLNDELAKSGGDTLRMTHEQVARYTGSAREVVTRMLNYFAAEGIVSLSRGGITVLDRKKLLGLTQTARG